MGGQRTQIHHLTAYPATPRPSAGHPGQPAPPPLQTLIQLGGQLPVAQWLPDLHLARVGDPGLVICKQDSVCTLAHIWKPSHPMAQALPTVVFNMAWAGHLLCAGYPARVLTERP